MDLFHHNIICGLVVIFLSPLTQAVCPEAGSLPTRFNSTHHLGAYYYGGATSDNPSLSCNGSPRRLPNGYTNMVGANAGLQFTSHALVVRPGCVVYEYLDSRTSTHDAMEYPSGIHPNIPAGSTGQSVSCNVPTVNCEPRDEISAVHQCDARESDVEIVCTYNKVVGTDFGPMLSNSMSSDANLGAELRAAFWELFRTKLHVSRVTRYNWANVPANVQGLLTTSQAQVTVAPGFLQKINQVVGFCGESQVKTEKFKISQEGAPKPERSSGNRHHFASLVAIVAGLFQILWMTSTF